MKEFIAVVTALCGKVGTVIVPIGLAATLISTAAYAAPIENSAPIADAGGPYSIYLGDGLTVNGSGSSDPDTPFGDFIAYQWDLDNDGLFDDAIGAIHTFTANDLNFLSMGIGTYTLHLKVTDSFGATGVDSARLAILAPEQVTNSVPLPGTLPLMLLGFAVAGTFMRRRVGSH